MKDVRYSIEFKAKIDVLRSQSHQASYSKDRIKREDSAIKSREREERRVRPMISNNSRIAFEHSNRAQSAREQRVNKLELQRVKWESDVETQRERVVESELQALNKSNNRREVQRKQYRSYEK